MLHSQSSRSHAVLEMEVVNSEVTELRAELIKIEGETVWAESNLGRVIEEWRPKGAPGRKKIKEGSKTTLVVNVSYVQNLKRYLARTRAKLDKIIEQKRDQGLGGTLTLVDLAGADHPAGFGGEVSRL